MSDDLRVLKINENRIKLLNSMDLFTVEDLLQHFPYRYDVIEETLPTDESDKIIIEGTLITAPKVFFKGKMSRMSFSMRSHFQDYKVFIFNRHYLAKSMKAGITVTVIGKCSNNNITASDLKVKPLDEIKGIHPIYSLKGITNYSFQGYVKKALKYYQFEEIIGEEFRIKNNLIHRDMAYQNIHFPETMEDVNQAVRYIKYEEFLKFQLTMQLSRSEKEEGVGKVFDVKALNDLIKSLPYKLTDDQQRAVREIIHDLRDPHMMYRFLQGDVGSGKTVVCALGLYANYLAGYQGALMAPTEILARQHFNSFIEIFKDTDMKIGLLVGSLSLKEKNDLYEKIEKGEINVIIGTHALFQEKVNYHNLGFVITDEQHRFGVNQRKALKDKGKQVDFMIMSATPIPRTLAISLYGDMDVSTIKTMPEGRIKPMTKYYKTSSMKPVLSHLLAYLKEGGQCYVICPLIEESETMDVRDATQIAQAMGDYFKDEYKVGLMHGGLKDDEKERIMNDFLENKIQILVSTTVVEVGVDVKNANMMVIYNAERFGLSQLHQLRGRIGRGKVQSYCYLLSSAENSEAIERLRYMESHSDGFEISNYDLQIRGPGEILGQRQSGLPVFLLGDIVKDYELLETCRRDALTIIERYLYDGSYGSLLENIKQELNSNNEYID